MIIDIEDMNRKRAPALATLQEMAGKPGADGVAGRLGLATADIDFWVADEFRRGTPLSEIASAMMKRAALLVVAQIASLGRDTDPGVAEARRALLDVFESQLASGLRTFDRMSDAERDANSTTVHQAQ